MSGVAVIGAAVHTFGRFDDLDAAAMNKWAARAALADAGIGWKDVGAVVVGSSRFSGGLSRGLGATDVLDSLGQSGVSAFNVTSACATGGSVFTLADALVRSGVHETVLAVGGEKMPPGFIARSPGSVEDASDVDYVRWACIGMTNPAYWALECTRRMKDHGTSERQLAVVASKAHELGVHNQHARYRKPIPIDDVLASPYVAWPLRLFEVCAVSDGAAAVVITSEERAAHADATPVRVAAAQVATNRFGDPALTMPQVSTVAIPGAAYVSETTLAVQRAFETSGLGPEDIDLIELTDNSVWQVLTYPELWGFCEAGETESLVEAGETMPDGRLPINPSGGFLCFGEATVAMGLFQIAEIVAQLRGRSGARQVPGARVGLAQTLGLGGYGTAVILST